MSNPIKRLHDDIHRYQAAQKTRATDAHNLHKAEHELKADTNKGKREHDAFDKNHKAYTKDHAKLLNTRSAEQAALKPALSAEAAAQSAYDASVDPTTGQGDPTLLAQLIAAKQAVTDIHTKYDSKIATETSTVTSERAFGKKEHDAILSTRKEIKHDRTAIKRDGKALDHAKAHVKADHKRALKDLQPAEYKMGLKGTNQARHALGLKSVKHVIRPDAGGKKVVDLAKSHLGKYESQLQREGVTLPCPTNESCANFVTSMLSKAGEINFRTLSVSTLNSDLRARGWHQVSLKDAKPGDVWICNGANGESHTEIVASNHNGHVTLIGSNNHPIDSNQQINYDTYSANISGSFILAPPGH